MGIACAPFNAPGLKRSQHFSRLVGVLLFNRRLPTSWKSRQSAATQSRQCEARFNNRGILRLLTRGVVPVPVPVPLLLALPHWDLGTPR